MFIKFPMYGYTELEGDLSDTIRTEDSRKVMA